MLNCMLYCINLINHFFTELHHSFMQQLLSSITFHDLNISQQRSPYDRDACIIKMQAHRFCSATEAGQPPCSIRINIKVIAQTKDVNSFIIFG